MGRVLVRVPPNWEHPKVPTEVWEGFFRKVENRYVSMSPQDYDTYLAKYLAEEAKWPEDSKRFFKDGVKVESYREFWGEPRDRSEFRPWRDADGTATWYQVWETVSDGTPVSPPFETPEELVEYLVKHGDFWDQSRREKSRSSNGRLYGRLEDCAPWPRAAAESFVHGSGWAPSFVGTIGGEFKRGFEVIPNTAADGAV